ncbi:Lysine--tRNA ligase [Candidatus Magnetaquicoccaceae bacterium FCR-1]|uniref:Lysine--tRNA ligase n=1 Tax=Candidatus Magnetaquiglobus chichijimensis TaxID=3141448 RepID=A0ABQ0C7W8_9PROT
MSKEENPLIAARKAKLQSLVEAGVNPYPNDFKPDDALGRVRAEYDAISEADTLAAVRVRCAGRIMLLRNFGKLTFATLADDSGRMQIAASRDEVGEALYRDVFRKIEVGDILGVEGNLFRTQTGELTIRVSGFKLLSKAVRPLPEKFHGLEDVEARYRQRYVDLIVNPEVRAVFRTRSRLIHLIRSFMEARGFLEVETPMMHPIPGGAVARPFVTHHNALDRDLYLRIAPELYLKRLIVGGFEKVFEINRNFRNEGLSVRHNPEFTMMEFYQAYADYRELMALTETLITHLVRELHGTLVITHQGRTIDFTPPWPRLTPGEALARHAGFDAERVGDRDYLEERAAGCGVKVAPAWDLGKLQLELFEALVESNLISPTFIIDYPVSVSPLSRRSDANPEITERFELFIGGWEIANAFSELNDPADQAERFRMQVAAKEKGDQEAMHFDADYIQALEYGMPPTAGEGIGIDRLTMLLTDSAAIRDVILFPVLRS